MAWEVRYNEKMDQVEGRITGYGSDIIVIFGNDGYDYKFYKRNDKYASTRGLNVHLAMNGPLQMTFPQMTRFLSDLLRAKAEAMRILRSY